MKILVFTDEYDYSYFTFIYNEIKMLQEAGLDVHVVCERVGKLYATDDNFTCIPQVKNKLFRRIFLQAYKRRMHRLLSLFSYFRERKKILKAFKPDIVHVHFGDTAVRLYFTMEKHLKKYPFLVSFHGFDAASLLLNQQYLDRLRILSGKENFFFIYVSNHLFKNLLKAGISHAKEKSFLLHYGIDITQFLRTTYPNNSVKKYLQISSFFEKKGHVYMIAAFKKFHERYPGKAQLIIGGDGPQMTLLKKLVRDMELENVVEFVGWVSRKQAVELMRDADYFVHHSITASNGDQEGMPNAIIEAMAMELPIISTWHSGIPELVEHEVNGYLVNEKDSDTLAQRMIDVMEWSYLPISREKIEKKFSLKVHTENLLAIYENIKSN